MVDKRTKRSLDELALPLSRELELETFVSPARGARMQGLSEDTFREENEANIVKLSKRRSGIRLRHVLKL
jgi:hypothetical protein